MSERAHPGRGWTYDVVFGLAVTCIAVAALLVPGVPWPLEWALALSLLVLAPGWALVSLALPGSPEQSDGSPRRAADGPDWIVRLALTPPASVLVVAGVTVVASATVGIRLVPVVVGVGAVTAVGFLGAWFRRWLLARERRASPLGRRGDSSPTAFGSTLQRVTFLLALLALVSAVAYAGANPPAAERYTEFYVLTETEGGDLVAADYPTADSADGNVALSLAIENDEGQEMTYDVVARAAPTGSGTPAEQVDRFQTSVPAGERVIAQRTYPARAIADGSRLQFLLYKDGVPADPSAENAALTLSVGGDGGDSAPDGGGSATGGDDSAADGIASADDAGQNTTDAGQNATDGGASGPGAEAGAGE